MAFKRKLEASKMDKSGKWREMPVIGCPAPWIIEDQEGRGEEEGLMPVMQVFPVVVGPYSYKVT